jgi:hypothetical protein
VPEIAVRVQAGPADLDSWLAQADEFGITSYVIRRPAVPDLERVLELL